MAKDVPNEPWVAHDDPDRPFDRLMWLCDCALCVAALKREARERPRLKLCIKTNCDRLVVTAEYLVEALLDGPIDDLCYVPGDWVREVFVVAEPWLLPFARWYSLTLDEDDRAAGRRRRSWRTKPEAPVLVGAPGRRRKGTPSGPARNRAKAAPAATADRRGRQERHLRPVGSTDRR